jgi:hypothetical protein
MRKLASFVAVAVLALMVGTAPAAPAAEPGVTPHDVSATFTDPDFCGTGASVDVTVAIDGVQFLTPNGGLDFVQVSHSTFTLTNPETGATVINHLAGRYTETAVSGDPDGIHTVEAHFIGLNEQLRSQDGGLLSRDAGVLVVLFTFDGDQDVSAEIVSITGPQPDAASDFALFCEVTTAALGL